jgi:hypothetical protein
MLKMDEFIGKELQTLRGGVLLVVDSDNHVLSKRWYTCVCSLCSQDKELWPYGSIQITHKNLLKGRIPCGCSKTPRWTSSQYEVKVKRKCSELGYIFQGWFGEYKGSRTYLDLENPITGNRWNTCIVSSLLSGAEDPLLKGSKITNKKTLPDEYHVPQFLETSAFLDGTVFHNLGKGKWSYICPTCSYDEYVKAGLCCGVFYSTYSNLKSGKKACRCAKGYQFSEEQQEYKIKKICELEGVRFLGWDGEYTGTKSNFKWICNNKHENSTAVRHFLLENTRCKRCSEISRKGAFNGRIPSMLDRDDDWLYLIRLNFADGTSCVKCGRTFNVKERLRNTKNKSKAVSIEKLRLWQGVHDTLWDTEQLVKNTMISLGWNFYDDKPWDGATESYIDDIEVIDRIFSIIEDSPLTLIEDNTA